MAGLDEQRRKIDLRAGAAAIPAAAVASAGLIIGVFELPARLESLVILPGLLLSLAAAAAPTFWIWRRGPRRSRLAAVTLAALLAAAAAGAGYWGFARDRVISVEVDGKMESYVLPKDPPAQAKLIAGRSGGDYAEALRSGPERERLRQLLERSGSGTLTALAALLLACHILLGFGLAGGLALAMGSEPTTPANEDDEPPSRSGGGSTRTGGSVAGREADGF